MPNSDFQDRLDRIRANSQQRTSSQITGASGHSGARKMNRGALVAGALVTALGLQSVKFVNESYELIKADKGPGLAMGLGIAAIGAVFIGIIVMFRAVRPKLSASAQLQSAGPSAPVRQPSKLAQVIFSLLGFTLGTVASFYMFVSSAARLAETDRAQIIANGAVLIALVLTVVSLLIGLVGLFVSRYPLRRVPVFFLLGGMLLFSTFRAFRIHPVDWPQFMALMQ